eukprot:7063554-Prymnesium_polylepis.1
MARPRAASSAASFASSSDRLLTTASSASVSRVCVAELGWSPQSTSATARARPVGSSARC